MVWARLSGARSYAGKTYGDGADLWFNRIGEVKRHRTKAQRNADNARANERYDRCVARCSVLSGFQNETCMTRCLN